MRRCGGRISIRKGKGITDTGNDTATSAAASSSKVPNGGCNDITKVVEVFFLGGSGARVHNLRGRR